MSQAEVMDEAQRRGGFTCRLTGTRPSEATCTGPSAEGEVGILVRGDAALLITLRNDLPADHPARAMRRFVRGFGRPAWRDRPWPPRPAPAEGYHTLWLDHDSTRAAAVTCRGPRLQPPCSVTLYRTTPARVQARLDTLLGIRR